MKSGTCLAVLLVLLVSAGCSSIWVDTDHDIVARCATCLSFDWQEHTSPESIPPEMLAQIREIISQQLESRGVKHVETSPDFLIAVDAGVAPDTISYDRDNILSGESVTWSKTDKRVMKKGSLVLSAFNGHTHKMFWRGTATSVLTESITDEEKLKLIRDAVVKMFEDFPPGK